MCKATKLDGSCIDDLSFKSSITHSKPVYTFKKSSLVFYISKVFFIYLPYYQGLRY